MRLHGLSLALRASMLPVSARARRRSSRQVCKRSAPLRRFPLLAAAILLVSASRLNASTVIAEWNPNSESNIAGYLLSYGMQSGNYTTTMDVGDVTTYSFSLTAGQTYYLAVQAYNTNSQVSSYSAEVVYTVPADAPTIVSLLPASGSLGTSVKISGSNFGATEGTSTVGFNGITA